MMQGQVEVSKRGSEMDLWETESEMKININISYQWPRGNRASKYCRETANHLPRDYPSGFSLPSRHPAWLPMPFPTFLDSCYVGWESSLDLPDESPASVNQGVKVKIETRQWVGSSQEMGDRSMLSLLPTCVHNASALLKSSLSNAFWASMRASLSRADWEAFRLRCLEMNIVW